MCRCHFIHVSVSLWDAGRHVPATSLESSVTKLQLEYKFTGALEFQCTLRLEQVPSEGTRLILMFKQSPTADLLECSQ